MSELTYGENGDSFTAPNDSGGVAPSPAPKSEPVNSIDPGGKFSGGGWSSGPGGQIQGRTQALINSGMDPSQAYSQASGEFSKVGSGQHLQSGGNVTTSPTDPAGMGGDPNWGEFLSIQQQQLLQNQAQAAADNAYREKYLSLISQPMLEVQRQQAATQAAQQKATEVYQHGLISAQNRSLDIQDTYQKALIAAQNRGLDITQAHNVAMEAAQNRALDIQQQQVTGQLGLGALGIAAGLRGPINAFQQQKVISGIDQNTGLSNAVKSLSGATAQPLTQQQFAAPQAANLSTLIEQVTGVKNVGQGTAGSMNPAAQPGSAANPQGATGVAPNTSAQDYGSALPAPQQIVSRNFNRMLPDTQQFALGAYETQGYSPSDVQSIIQRNNPQFQAPVAGAASI